MCGARAAKLIDQVYCAMLGMPYPGAGPPAAEAAAHGGAGLAPELLAGAAQGCAKRGIDCHIVITCFAVVSAFPSQLRRLRRWNGVCSAVHMQHAASRPAWGET